MIDALLKILKMLPEILSLFKKIYDAIKGAPSKEDAKLRVGAMKDACHGIACPADLK